MVKDSTSVGQFRALPCDDSFQFVQLEAIIRCVDDLVRHEVCLRSISSSFRGRPERAWSTLKSPVSIPLSNCLMGDAGISIHRGPLIQDLRSHAGSNTASHNELSGSPYFHLISAKMITLKKACKVSLTDS